MIFISDRADALLEQFLEALRTDEMAKLDDDLVERLDKISGIDEQSTTSPWTDLLLERGIKPSTIVWLIYAMTADAMRRGWISAHIEYMGDDEGDWPSVKARIYWDGMEFNFSGAEHWLRLDYVEPSDDR